MPTTTGGDGRKAGNGQARFTPGPWKALIEKDGRYFPSVQIGPEYTYPDKSGKGTDTITINCGASPEEVEAGVGFGTDDETVNANAHLIAAAPDLFEACRAAINYLNFTTTAAKGLKRQLRAAIAKATGDNA